MLVVLFGCVSFISLCVIAWVLSQEFKDKKLEKLGKGK